MKIAFLSLLAVSLLPAQIPGTFQQVDIDGGGWFTGITQHSSGRLYGRTDVGGAYRSDDEGESWAFLSGDFAHPGGLFVQGLAVSPSDPNTIYQACGVSYFPEDPERGIWKSSDAGATWRQVKADLNFSGNDEVRQGGECILVHPFDHSEVWAGSRGEGLWKSSNAGQSWEEIAPTTFKDIIIAGITIHPSFPDQVWVSTEGGLWISWDRGTTWKHELKSGVVLRTARRTDGSGFAIGGTHHPSTPTDTKLWHLTKDDWTKPGKITFTDRWPNYVSAHKKVKGYEPTDQAAALSLLRDGSLVTAGYFRDPARSRDDGQTFEILAPTIVGKFPVWTLPDPKNHQGGWNHLFQDIKNDDRWFTTGGYGPSRSEDSGKTWKYITKGIGEVVTWRTQFHPTNGSVILPSADHGLTMAYAEGSKEAWNTISRNFPYPDDILTFAHSAFALEKTVIAFGGAPNSGEARIWKSDSAGAEWQKISPKGYPQKRGHVWVEMSGTPHEFIGLMGGPIGPGKGGLYRSTDSCASFTQIELPPETLGLDAGNQFVWNTRLCADGADSSRHYLSIMNSGIFRSDDKGLTWKRLHAEGLPNPNGWLGIDHKAKHRVWFAGYDGLHRSDDSGDTWLRIEGFEQTFDVDAVDGRVAVIGKMTGDDFKKIYYSADNGATWREITRKNFRFGNMTFVAIDPHHHGRVWISTSGRSTAIFTPTE